MKLTMRVGAAMGIIALAGCGQSGQENAANLEAGTEMTANETVLPPDDATGETDTLGNQLNQLNESDAYSGNTADTTSNEN